MIEPFYGEFLISPVPLELSFNYCSHKCAFCFANLGVPDRRVDIKAVMRFVQSFRERKSYAAKLMQAGYPVCISNKVDPLAVTNDAQSIPVIEMLAAMGVPVQIQTRGGRREDDLLAIVPAPSVWYISFDTLDEKIRKAIEPGAPTIEKRLELVAKVAAKGHKVILGLNPLTPEWCPEPENLIDECYDRGVRHVWIEALHLHRDQEKNLTDKERKAMGSETLARAMQKTWTADEKAHMDRAHNHAWGRGMETFTVGYWHRSAFHQAYRDCYPKTFPVMQYFINWCWETVGNVEDEVVEYDDFERFLLPHLPEGVLPICHYIRATNYGAVEAHPDLPNNLSFRGLLQRAWCWKEVTFAPSRMRCFAVAIDQQPESWTIPVDERGMPWHVWKPRGTEDRYSTTTKLETV